MSWFSRFDPIPGFPAYPGPYQTGSVDVEIPAADLDTPGPAPDPKVSTVAFRIFYPCEPSSGSDRPVRWIPNPQRSILGAYARFLGGGYAFSGLFSLFPQHLYYIAIPARRNGTLLTPTTHSCRWPVVVFSHGLGGSRNSYSYLLGSLASHGLVVIAPDHRDGSSPIQFIRATDSTAATTVEYRKLAHTPSPEVYQGRDEMLRIRLWELATIHDAILKIDGGQRITNLDGNSVGRRKKDKNDVLGMFAGKLDIHDPGTIVWAGHSFGAATSIQFVKSVFWRPDSNDEYVPLLSPPPALLRQITPSTPMFLLDLWCMPLQSPSTKWLRDKPMPCYSPSGPGGCTILSVLSESFFKWRKNLIDTKRALCPPRNPGANANTESLPRFFYPVRSAHLSQSDFGILFPRLCRMAFKADDPERALRLNTRAVLEHLRNNGIEVADTSLLDSELKEGNQAVVVADSEKSRDWRILATNGNITGWFAVSAELEAPDEEDVTSPEEERNQVPADSVQEGEVLGELRKEPAPVMAQ